MKTLNVRKQNIIHIFTSEVIRKNKFLAYKKLTYLFIYKNDFEDFNIKY